MPYANPQSHREHTNAYAKEYARKKREDPEFLAKQAASSLAYYYEHREHIKARRRARWARDRDKIRDARLKAQYGLQPGEYEEILERQGGVCAICGQPETALTNAGELRKMPVDHDHKTGHVRGILCTACNHMLGCGRDDPAILAKAIVYLRRH